MARLARIVIPGIAHHVTQRGNRRLPVSFSDDDRRTYLALVADACASHGTRCLAWCLMDNHVHLILVPTTADGLRAALGEAHRRYGRRINFREGWRGYLFQGRFASYPMDDAHLMAAVRYVENNPVAAKMVAEAGDWPWSSARAPGREARGGRSADRRGGARRTCPQLASAAANWPGGDGRSRHDRRHRAQPHRPLATPEWIAEMELRIARKLGPLKRGPKVKAGI